MLVGTIGQGSFDSGQTTVVLPYTIIQTRRGGAQGIRVALEPQKGVPIMRPAGRGCFEESAVRNAQAVVMPPERATKSQNNTKVTKQPDRDQIRVWDNKWRTDSK